MRILFLLMFLLFDEELLKNRLFNYFAQGISNGSRYYYFE